MNDILLLKIGNVAHEFDLVSKVTNQINGNRFELRPIFWVFSFSIPIDTG